MSFTEDFSVFFENSEFSDTVTRADGTTKFEAIFDESAFSPELGEMVIEGGKPRLTCRASDIASLPAREVIMVKGKQYTVIKAKLDGTGTAMVELTKFTSNA